MLIWNVIACDTDILGSHEIVNTKKQIRSPTYYKPLSFRTTLSSSLRDHHPQMKFQAFETASHKEEQVNVKMVVYIVVLLLPPKK